MNWGGIDFVLIMTAIVVLAVYHTHKKEKGE